MDFTVWIDRIADHWTGQLTRGVPTMPMFNLIKVGRGTHAAAMRRKVPIDRPGQTGYTTEPDGKREAVLEVLIDPAALIRILGTKALLSKAGISKLQGGAVTVRVLKETIKHHPEQVRP